LFVSHPEKQKKASFSFLRYENYVEKNPASETPVYGTQFENNE